VAGDEVAGGQVVEVLAGDGRVEAPIEVVERLEGAELGGADTAVELALAAGGELVLEDEFEELEVGEPVGGGFLEADIEAVTQTGEPELAQGDAGSGS